MKLSILAAVILLPVLSNARPIFLNELRIAFPEAPLTLRCTNCHSTGGPQLNAFGKEFGMLRRQFGPAHMDQVWAQLRNADSDQDGVDNETEFNADRNPGRAD